MRALAVLAVLVLVSCHSRPSKQVSNSTAKSNPPGVPHVAPDSEVTKVYIHNLLLRKGPNFKARIKWLRGQIKPTNRSINPSLDDPKSFSISIQSGVVGANLADLTAYLSANPITSTSVKDLKFSAEGNQIKLNATYHKVFPFPIQAIGDVAAAPGDKIRVHIVKLNVLKVPIKGLLSHLHVNVADLFDPKGMNGVQVSGDDVYLDTSKMLPPPHLEGKLTSIRVQNGDILEVFGNVEQDLNRTEHWRNFMRLKGGNMDLGKLTMHQVDLIMVDTSADEWFDLDLDHYADQLVYGYTRMTPQAGLQIFMPDVDEIPHTKQRQNISMEWLKNRNVAAPADVTSNEHTK
jgi:hypothetical protein